MRSATASANGTASTRCVPRRSNGTGPGRARRAPARRGRGNGDLVAGRAADGAGLGDTARSDGPRHRPQDGRGVRAHRGRRQDDPLERSDGRVRARAVQRGYARRGDRDRPQQLLQRGRRRRLTARGEASRARRRIRPPVDGRGSLARVPRGARPARHHRSSRTGRDRSNRCRPEADHRGQLEDAQDAPRGDPGRAEAELPARQGRCRAGRGRDLSALHRTAIGPHADRIRQAAVRPRRAERVLRGGGRVHRRGPPPRCCKRSTWIT